MKKKIKIIVIVALILIILVPYIFVEGNTLLFGSEFKNQYKQTNMIDDIEYYKVFYNTNKTAKVYYVESDHEAGHFIWFKKEKSKWKMTKWTTVWSQYGSALSLIHIQMCIRDRVMAGENFPPKKCLKCLKKCNPANIPYCITERLINAAEGNVDNGLLFCGANAYMQNEITTVHRVIEKLFGQFKGCIKK